MREAKHELTGLVAGASAPVFGAGGAGMLGLDNDPQVGRPIFVIFPKRPIRVHFARLEIYASEQT